MKKRNFAPPKRQPGAEESPRMEELAAGDFAPFFRDIHGEEPFPWQQRLMEHVLDRGTWPKVIDLPTGTGKTAVLDIAVFAMAARPETSSRRIVFVIDRRIVVDQVYRRAGQIRTRINEGKTAVLKRVRDRLRDLSGGIPLEAVSLRGGIPLENEWARRPDQPWVIVSTVDQFGSRLLFRGYGVARGMRPIHAALAGNDCLVILDEVHLSVPFAKTLDQISGLESGRLPRRFTVVEMSATPSDTEAERFVLDPATDLEECEELRRRVNAKKSAKLVKVQNQEAIPAAVLKIVGSIGRNATDGVRSVGVVVNLVRTARETHQKLECAGYETSLITGRMRPLDRKDVLDRVGPAVDPDGNHTGKLAVVVATQAIEVGADFSFDALVTECAPVDSLRQRFGRLDRRGKYSERSGAPARAWIIGPRSIVGSKKPDPIYGDSTKETWKELERLSEEEGSLDVGSCALRGFGSATAAPRSIAPLLQKTHMDTWIQTNPEPLTQPSVEWFLHGIEKYGTPDVSIVWRRDRSDEALKLVPPRQAEFMPVPIKAAKSWLSGYGEASVADVDREGEEEEGSPSRGKGTDAADWVRWNGFSEDAKRVEMNEIRPGDVLVVNPDRGGLKVGTWDPTSTEQVSDLGDAAQHAHGRRVTLRLDPLLPHMNYADPPPAPSDEAGADTSARERIGQWLKRRSDDPKDRNYEIIRMLGNSFDIVPVGMRTEKPGKGYYVLSKRHPRTKRPVVDTAMMDGSDETGSLIGTGVTLKRHLEGVAERAGQIAGRLRLDPEFVEDLRLAGLLHDIGKVDRRFQAQLVGGDPVYLEMYEEPLAKSLPGVRRRRIYPAGMRHEVASVAMLESNSKILDRAKDRDLVLHLVGTHHGWGRPLPPIIADQEPQKLSYTFGEFRAESDSNLADSRLALDMTDRFWRLVERYGYYGLAWLESILRLADHQQSAEEAAQE